VKNAKRAFDLMCKDLLVIEPMGIAYAALAEDGLFSAKIVNVEKAIHRLADKNGPDAMGSLPFKRVLTIRSIVAMVMLGYPAEAIDWLKSLGANYQGSATSDEAIFSHGCTIGMIFGLNELSEAGEPISPGLEEAVAQSLTTFLQIGKEKGLNEYLKDQNLALLFRRFITPANSGKDGEWGRAETINFVLTVIKADRKKFGLMGEELGRMLCESLLGNLEWHSAWQTVHFALGLMMRHRAGPKPNLPVGGELLKKKKK